MTEYMPAGIADARPMKTDYMAVSPSVSSSVYLSHPIWSHKSRMETSNLVEVQSLACV